MNYESQNELQKCFGEYSAHFNKTILLLSVPRLVIK